MKTTSRTTALVAVVGAAVIVGGLSASPALAYTTAPSASVGTTQPIAVSFSSTGKTAYVVDEQGYINFVTTSSHTVAHQIQTAYKADTSGALGGGALSANGSNLFVSVDNSTNGPELLQYSTTTRKLVHNFSLGTAGDTASLGAVALSADGGSAYVRADTGGTTPQVAVYEVDLASSDFQRIELGDAGATPHPAAVVVSPDGSTAWVSTDHGTVAKIDTSADSDAAITDDIELNADAEGLALDSTGSTLYVAETNGDVQAIATATDSVNDLATVAGAALSAIALTRSGSQLLVAGSVGNLPMAFVLDAATGAEGSRILLGASRPWAIAASPTGTKAYIADEGLGNGKVSIVSLVKLHPTLKGDSVSTKGTVGKPFSAQFSATGYPSPTYSATGILPTGVTLDGVSGVLSGSPTAIGNFKFTIVASNGIGKDSSGVKHTVIVKYPLVTSIPSVTATGTATGDTLTVDPGDWGPGTVKLGYQWERSVSKLGGADRGWTKIGSATGAVYTLKSKDHNHLIRVVVTGSETHYWTATAADDGTPIP